jgi:hypothetical protein
VCAEGEWHALSARMIATLIGDAGYRPCFLGPSLPAGDLSAFLATAGMAGVAVHCSMVATLPGAARSIAASSAAGVGAVAVGRGFRADPAVAEAMGADPWAPGSPLSFPPSRAGLRVPPSVTEAEIHHASMVRSAMERTGHVRRESEEALSYALGSARGIAVTKSDRIAAHEAAWLAAFCSGRGIGAAALDELMGALAGVAREVVHQPEPMVASISRLARAR